MRQFSIAGPFLAALITLFMHTNNAAAWTFKSIKSVSGDGCPDLRRIKVTTAYERTIQLNGWTNIGISSLIIQYPDLGPRISLEDSGSSSKHCQVVLEVGLEVSSCIMPLYSNHSSNMYAPSTDWVTRVITDLEIEDQPGVRVSRADSNPVLEHSC